MPEDCRHACIAGLQYGAHSPPGCNLLHLLQGQELAGLRLSLHPPRVVRQHAGMQPCKCCTFAITVKPTCIPVSAAASHASPPARLSSPGRPALRPSCALHRTRHQRRWHWHDVGRHDGWGAWSCTCTGLQLPATPVVGAARGDAADVVLPVLVLMMSV